MGDCYVSPTPRTFFSAVRTRITELTSTADRAHRLTVIALSVLLVVVVIANGLGASYTDIKPEVYEAPAAMVGHYLSSWTASPYLGSANFNVGLTPVVLALAPLDLLGFSAKWVFLLSHAALWLVAAAGAARLARELAPHAGAWTPLATAVAYIANPYAVVGGSTLAVLLPFAFLPWLAYALVRALRDPRSWRWPAAVALAFTAMSGMNVAVIPIFQLLVVLPIALVVGRAAGLGARAIAWVLAKCGALVLLVSLYWLIPSISAIATGQQIVAESETLDGIASVSTFVEALRGMGIWTLYGSASDGPWVPQYAAYQTAVPVVLASVLWPALALLALRSATPVVRRIAALLIGIGAVTMVGLYAAAGPSPVALTLNRLFEAIPPLLAFRTTNKAGAVLMLGAALALGAAAPRWLAAARRQDRVAILRHRYAGLALTAVLVGLWVYPAAVGRLYTSPIDIPGYWRAAASAADAGGPSSRVLFLPGQTRPTYRWTDERPDDLPNSLMTREAIIPETTPNTSPPGANVLAAVTDLLASGTAGPTTISSMTRYLGAGSVLVRHDIAWEDLAGARPDLIASRVGYDPGLALRAAFGRPGENLQGQVPLTAGESTLPPVQLYDVRSPLSSAAVRPLTGSVLVAGDAWAFDSLGRAGLLNDAPLVRFAPTMSTAERARAVATAGRLALTDTNRRAAVITNRLTAGLGPLLPPQQTPAGTRSLGSAEDQSVLRREGPQVTASQTGGAFFDVPYGQPDNVLDGRPETAWLFGDFRRAPGVTLDVRFTTEQELKIVTIRPVALGPVHLDKITLEAGGQRRTVTLPDSGVASVDFGGLRADGIRLHVDTIRGEGFSLVGIAELGLPGPKVTRIARLPQTWTTAYAGLDTAGRAAFDRLPLDIFLTRVRNAPGPPDDSEITLERDLSVPSPRTFAPEALVRLPAVGPRTADDLAGLDPAYTLSASSILWDNPDLRASQAADGDLGTGWVPGSEEVVGDWWQVTGPERTIKAITVRQKRMISDTDDGRYVRQVSVLIDGDRVVRAWLTPGSNTITLPKAVRGKTVRVVIDRVSGRGGPPRLVDIDTGTGPLLPKDVPCHTIATLDGQPLLMRPGFGTRLAGPDQEGTRWVACSPVTLGAGEHRIRSVRQMQLDSLTLHDTVTPAATAAVATPTLSASGRTTARTLTFTVAPGQPVAVRIGEGYDARWRATLDGRDLGAPVVLDGWSAGWLVDTPGAHTMQVRYGPQRAATIALIISTVTLLGCALLALLPRIRRRPEPVRAPAYSRPVLPLGPRSMAGVTVAGATFATGGAGLFAGLLTLWLTRRRADAPRILVAMGAAVVALAGVVQVLLAWPRWGDVNAMVVSHSAIPHLIAAAGLTLAVLGALFDSPSATTSPPSSAVTRPLEEEIR